MQFSKNVIHLINAKTTGGIEIGAKQAEKLLKKKLIIKLNFYIIILIIYFQNLKKFSMRFLRLKEKLIKVKVTKLF